MQTTSVVEVLIQCPILKRDIELLSKGWSLKIHLDGLLNITNYIMKDNVEIWKPLPDLPDNMYIEAIYDDNKGVRIILGCDQFKDRVLKVEIVDKISYRNTDESFMLKVWDSMNKEDLGKTFYVVKNSSYIDFFKEMTFNLHDDWDIEHYAIYTTEDCIDILSINEPVAEWQPR